MKVARMVRTCKPNGECEFFKVLLWNQTLDGKILSRYSIKTIFEGVYWVHWQRIGSCLLAINTLVILRTDCWRKQSLVYATFRLEKLNKPVKTSVSLVGLDSNLGRCELKALVLSLHRDVWITKRALINQAFYRVGKLQWRVARSTLQ